MGFQERPKCPKCRKVLRLHQHVCTSELKKRREAAYTMREIRRAWDAILADADPLKPAKWSVSLTARDFAAELLRIAKARRNGRK